MTPIAELLSSPNRWTQTGYALDEKGRECKRPTDGDACRWCLVAAIRACYSGSDVLSVQRKLRQALLERGWTKPLGHWAGAKGRKHKEVLELVTGVGV
jgi:hypothetical protein